MNFIGVDLAWKIAESPKLRTGLAAIDSGGQLVGIILAATDNEILAFIQKHAGDSCAVGIDAPLIVPNETGHRPVELLLAKRGIPAYPANRSLFKRVYGGVRGEVLVKRLQEEGFFLSMDYPKDIHRVIFEVFPSPAYKAILGLDIKVKRRKGVGTSDIQKGLAAIRDKLLSLTLDPLLVIGSPVRDKLSVDIGELRGAALDQFGDILDAILCAYIIYRYYFDCDSAKVVGDLETGYILLPKY